jgi:hypothetical protein
MNYKVRENLGNIVENTSRNMRFRIRRNYLRSDIDKFDYERKELSKEQKKAIDDFWKPYTKNICYKWHEFFYSITGVFDPRFIPEDLMFTEIEGYLNDWSSAHGLDNKNNYQFYFPEIKHPKVAFRRMSGIFHLGDYSLCTLEEAIESAASFGEIIIKNALEAGKGASIRLWKTEDGIETLREIINSSNADIVAQEFIKQHSEMEAFNPSSVNSIRVVTLVLNNKVNFLCAYLRVGQAGVRIDNVCAGGMCSAVSEDGYLCGYAYDKHAKKVYASPTGKEFNDFRIPAWDKVLSTVKQMHNKLGNFRLVSWDIAISPDEEPIFIEMNLKYGAMEYHQLFKGPLFGEYTEQVLNEVYGKN